MYLVKCVLPQKTIVFLILFNVKINGIHLLPLKNQIIYYADNTVLLFSG